MRIISPCCLRIRTACPRLSLIHIYSGDAEKNAAEAYTQTVQYFASTSGVVVVRLHHSKATPRLTEALCSYIGRQGISAGRITYSVAPVNSASDTR